MTIATPSALPELGNERIVAERARLLRYCYRFTGDPDAAEDLVQETMLEALRNAHKLHDPSGHHMWLSSIARNVCLRYNQRRGRDARQILTSDLSYDLDPVDNSYDLDVELDRRELVDLLDRAMAMLPAESRDVLVERYVNESPHAEIAERLGLTGPTVAKRVERGKLRLKRLLETEFIHASRSYGLAPKLFGDWEETNVWCPVCGRRQLLAKRLPDGMVWFICKPCLKLDVSLYATSGPPGSTRGANGYSAIHYRMMENHQKYEQGIDDETVWCPFCRKPVSLRVSYEPTITGWHFVYADCPHYGQDCWQFVSGWHLLATPEGQAFYREHQRIRVIPDRVIEAGGVPAVVTGFDSATGSARIEGIFVRDTFQRVGIHVTPGD